MDKQQLSKQSSELIEMIDLANESSATINIVNTTSSSSGGVARVIDSAPQILQHNSSIESGGPSVAGHVAHESASNRWANVTFSSRSSNSTTIEEKVISANSSDILQEKDSKKQIPPSYSTVLKFGPPITYFESSAYPAMPFIERIPPPSYVQVSEWHANSSVPSADSIYPGPTPLYVMCPRCRALVITETQIERSCFSYASAVVLCICLCWPFCLVPLCLQGCQNTYHFCPNCHHYLGVYKPC